MALQLNYSSLTHFWIKDQTICKVSVPLFALFKKRTPKLFKSHVSRPCFHFQMSLKKKGEESFTFWEVI